MEPPDVLIASNTTVFLVCSIPHQNNQVFTRLYIECNGDVVASAHDSSLSVSIVVSKETYDYSITCYRDDRVFVDQRHFYVGGTQTSFLSHFYFI